MLDLYPEFVSLTQRLDHAKRTLLDYVAEPHDPDDHTRLRLITQFRRLQEDWWLMLERPITAAESARTNAPF